MGESRRHPGSGGVHLEVAWGGKKGAVDSPPGCCRNRGALGAGCATWAGGTWQSLEAQLQAAC